MKLNKSFQKCLILVPHPDDETNIAGNLIHDLRDAGTDVYVCYATNGDWKYPAQIRQKEALAALKVLGDIDKDHVFFLGYGDAYFDPSHSHMFYSESIAVTSRSGHTETYGTEILPDYAFFRRGQHSPYCKDAYCRDLTDLILWLKADLLVCSDLDEHPDHRMLSLCFDEVMGRILKQETDYKPTVLKAFAYNQAYCAVPDLYEGTNETKPPEIGKTEHYEYDMVGRSVYEWDNRISLSVSDRFADRRLYLNRKAKALSKHLSQPIVFRAERIINSDEVFWQRRTDSLSYAAAVTVSSGNGAYLNDFRLYGIVDIDSVIPVFGDYLWRPDPDDSAPEIRFDWQEPQTISTVRLYGDLDIGQQTGPVTIQFDEGGTISHSILPAYGCPLTVSLEPVKTKSCIIRVPAGTAIAECEFFGTEDEKLRDSSSVDITKASGRTRLLNKIWFMRAKVRSVGWKVKYSLKYKGVGWIVRKAVNKAGITTGRHA